MTSSITDSSPFSESRALLRHFLAALAYRTQKALRDAPASFPDFRIAPTTRTPKELVWHMTSVIGYARTVFHGGQFAPVEVSTFAEEIERFHETLAALGADLADPTLTATVSDRQLLQGPLADAMTHAGQLAMLRRLAGSPVPSENFLVAAVDVSNLTSEQPMPVAPDAWWNPGDPPRRPDRYRDAEPNASA